MGAKRALRIWQSIFSALAGAGDAPDRLFIDDSCIKVPRCAGGGKRGASTHAIGRTRADETPNSTPSATQRAAPASCS